jgi:hypothetical protein
LERGGLTSEGFCAPGKQIPITFKSFIDFSFEIPVLIVKDNFHGKKHVAFVLARNKFCPTPCFVHRVDAKVPVRVIRNRTLSSL